MPTAGYIPKGDNTKAFPFLESMNEESMNVTKLSSNNKYSHTGKVKFFRNTWGLAEVLTPTDEKGQIVFVHYTKINCQGFRTLVQDARIGFTVEPSRNQSEERQAVNIHILKPADEDRKNVTERLAEQRSMNLFQKIACAAINTEFFVKDPPGESAEERMTDILALLHSINIHDAKVFNIRNSTNMKIILKTSNESGLLLNCFTSAGLSIYPFKPNMTSLLPLCKSFKGFTLVKSKSLKFTFGNSKNVGGVGSLLSTRANAAAPTLDDTRARLSSSSARPLMNESTQSAPMEQREVETESMKDGDMLDEGRPLKPLIPAETRVFCFGVVKAEHARPAHPVESPRREPVDKRRAEQALSAVDTTKRLSARARRNEYLDDLQDDGFGKRVLSFEETGVATADSMASRATDCLARATAAIAKLNDLLDVQVV